MAPSLKVPRYTMLLLWIQKSLMRISAFAWRTSQSTNSKLLLSVITKGKNFCLPTALSAVETNRLPGTGSRLPAKLPVR